MIVSAALTRWLLILLNTRNVLYIWMNFLQIFCELVHAFHKYMYLKSQSQVVINENWTIMDRTIKSRTYSCRTSQPFIQLAVLGLIHKLRSCWKGRIYNSFSVLNGFENNVENGPLARNKQILPFPTTISIFFIRFFQFG